METELLTGKDVLKEMRALANEHREVLTKHRVAMVLVAPQDGMDPLRYKAAEISAAEKVRTFTSIGVAVDKRILPATVSRTQFADILDELAGDPTIGGIIVQLPVAKDFRSELQRIPEIKDIDGVTAGNAIFPICATADAALRVIAPVAGEGQNLVVVGGKGFVGGAVAYGLRLQGSPYAVLEMGDDLTQTNDFQLVISTTGQPNLLNEQHLNGQARVVDVGFMPLRHDIRDFATDVAGDVDKCAYKLVHSITPVPGGIGPLQMAVLIERMINKATGEYRRRWEYPT